MDWCRDIDYGNLPQWIGTLGTVFALLWAVFLYRQSLADRKMEQARLVSVVPLEPEVVGVGETFEIPFGHGNIGGTTSHQFLHVERGAEESSVNRATKRLIVRRFEVANQSTEVISDLVAEVKSQSGDALGSRAHTVYLRAGEIHKFTFFTEWGEEHWFSRTDALSVVVRFTDNLGTRWSKTVGGPLEHAKNDDSGMRVW